MSQEVNQTLSHDEQIFKDVVWTPLFETGNLWLLANVPALDVPVIKQIEGAIEGAVSDWLFNALKEFIDVTYVKLKNAAAQKAWAKASIDLKVIAATKGIDSDEYKNARDAAKASLSNFTRIHE